MKETAVPINIIANQRGMALISALLLLLVVSLMAVGVSMDTSMDVRIAGYQRFKARAFSFAESGGMAAVDILEDNIHDAGAWDASGGDVTYPGLSSAYVGTLKVKQGYGDFYMKNNEGEAVVMEMTGDINARIVSQRLVAKAALGGAIQMAAGYGGLGKGAGAGGTHRIYNLIATGSDVGQNRSDLAVYFRHVTN